MKGPEPLRPTTRTVLVVDDDAEVRHLLRATVELAGHRVVDAADGAEALELIKRSAPDLVLLDVRMPRLDGAELCRWIKGNPATRDVTVLMLTSASREDERRRGLEAGADGYITKPFSVRSLLDQFGAYLGAS